MAIEHKLSTGNDRNTISGIGMEQDMKTEYRVANISAIAETGSTYTFGRLPSYARLCFSSRYGNSGSQGANGFKCGVFGVDGNIIDDDDAIFTVTSALQTAADIIRTSEANVGADRGKPIWQFVNGQTEDPGGFLDIKITLTGNNGQQMGQAQTIGLCLIYDID